MRKILLIICLNLLFATIPLIASAETVLTGGVDFTVNSAREVLMRGNSGRINPTLISANIYDNENHQNISALLKGSTELKDRTLASFSDGTYAVMYKNDELHVWYYSASGELIYAEEKDGVNYPYKSYKYNPSTKLVNMGLRVSKGETFIYTPDGKLIAHWINQNGYDENGNVVMKRKYAE